MAIQINGGLQNNSPEPLNKWYHKGLVQGISIPYSNVQEVNTTIPVNYRSKGMTVLVTVSGQNVEYWYKDGITDSDLQEKEVRLVAGPNINITYQGNIAIVSATASGGGDSSTTETFGVTGDFSKAFTAGTSLVSFLLVPPDTNTYIISVGTTSGGNDLFDHQLVNGSDPQYFEYLKYFTTSQSWFFTGVPSGMIVRIKYDPPIILV